MITPEKLKMSSAEIRSAAIVLAMVEVSVRSEPREYAPELAAHVRARRPSEISRSVAHILECGFMLWAELETDREGTLADLSATGLSETDAIESFVHSVQAAKWRYMATLAAEGGSI